MELVVYWTQFAEDKLEDIYHYYSLKAGKKIALKLVNEVVDSTIDLQRNPLAGQEEEILKKRPQKFRYLVSGNYKIIYWINKSRKRVEIVHVFDCRRNPKTMKKMK